MAAIVRKDTKNLRVSQEGAFTYNFKSFDGKVKDAQERIGKFTTELNAKIPDLNENPVAVNHSFIYKLLTKGGKVVDDKADAVLKDTLAQLDKLSAAGLAPALSMMPQVLSIVESIQDAESGAAAIDKLKALKNPWPALNAAVNGTRGIELMGNVRISGEQVSGTKGMGGWEVSGYLDMSKDNEAEGNKVSKLWKVASVLSGIGIATTVAPLAGPAVAIGALVGVTKANINNLKGYAIKSNISVDMLKSMVQQTQHLVDEVAKDRAEFLKFEDEFDKHYSTIKEAKGRDKASAKAAMGVASQLYDVAASVEYITTKHRLWLINAILSTIQIVIAKTK
jgi:hypothetical protein